VSSQRFERNPGSGSSFGADDNQRGSICKTIVAENCILSLEPHREKPVGQIRRTTAQNTNRVNLILGEASADQICNRIGYIEWVPKQSSQYGPRGVAFRGQQGSRSEKSSGKSAQAGDYLNKGEYTLAQADPWATPTLVHTRFLPLSWLQKQQETFVFVEELLPSRPAVYVANREAHLAPV
jgi:hypothetical protein